MGGLNQAERYFAADCALLFATSLVAIVVTFGLMWLARRRGDPARLCLLHVKIAAVFFILFCFVDFCADALWLAFSQMMQSASSDSYEDIKLLSALLKARVELAAVSRLADCLVVIFIFLCVVTFGIGINIIRKVEQRTDALIKRICYAFAILLGLISIVQWGIRVRAYLDFYTQEFRTTTEDSDSLGLLSIARKIDLSFVVVQWSLAMATFIRSIQIWIHSRFDKRVERSPLFLVLCSTMFLTRATYGLVYQIKFINIEDIQNDPDPPPFMEVLSLIFQTWTVFTIICLMLALGIKKAGGFWSTVQYFEEDPRHGQDVPLETRNSSPPAYSPPHGAFCTPAQTSPETIPSLPEVHITGARQEQPPQAWHQPVPAERMPMDDHDGWLVQNLEPPPHRPLDNGYNTGIDLPFTTSEAGPARAYDLAAIPPQSPPPHAEAMGLNHQADGVAPRTAPLPYPEKN